MLNESVKPVEALGDLIGLFIGLYEREDEPDLPKETLLKHVQILLTEVKRSTKSEAEKDSRNAKLVHENDELMAENTKLKELMEWAARIIDSGMGAGILRYEPIQFFIDYHTYLKSLEELNHE